MAYEEQGTSAGVGGRVSGVFRRYLWNSSLAGALLLSSPAILSAVGSFTMSQSIDRDIAGLTRNRDAMAETSRQLESFKENLERYQLDRAAMLILLNGVGADTSLKYSLDKLFRLNAQDSMRRVAATLYPSDWKTRMQPYEEITAAGYGDYDSIQRLQSFESGMIQDAAHRLVLLQEGINSVSTRIDDQTSFRTAVLSAGNSIMYLLSIIIFLLKTARQSGG